MSLCTRQFQPTFSKPHSTPMFSTTEPRVVKLRHWTKTTRQGTNCGACGQRIPPHTEHECWTLEPVPERDAR